MKKRKDTTRKNKMEKTNSDAIIRKLYSYLRTHPNSIFFKKLPAGLCGYYEEDTEEITLDYRKDIVPTLIHEFVHYLHPTWTEKLVFQKERQVMRSLTGIQCRNIMRLLGDSIV